MKTTKFLISTPKIMKETHTNDKWLEKLDAILDNRIGMVSLDNELLAEEMGISPRQFYRKIKETTNKSPNQYIRQFKLQKALAMIQSGKYLTVQEVGLAVGFQNIYYFSQIFKKKYSKTPLVMLKELGYR